MPRNMMQVGFLLKSVPLSTMLGASVGGLGTEVSAESADAEPAESPSFSGAQSASISGTAASAIDV